jgi:hypothetical protein
VFQFRDSTTFAFESDISKVSEAQKAAIRTAMAKARFVRIAVIERSKMLRTCSMSASGKLRHSIESLRERQLWAVLAVSQSPLPAHSHHRLTSNQSRAL